MNREERKVNSLKSKKDRIILEVLLAVLSSDTHAKSKEIVTVVARDMIVDKEKEYQIINNLIKAYNSTKQWPTYEYLLEHFGYECQRLNLNLNVRNNAEAVSIFEIEIEKHQRYELGTDLVEISKMTQEESFPKLRSAINKSLLMIEKNVKRESLSLRESYNKKKDLPAGILTFIKSIDNDMGGVRKGTMMTLGGFAGHYKTRTFTSMLYKNITECKQNGVMISLELPSEILWSFLLSRHSMDRKFSQIGEPINSNRIMDSQLSLEEENFIFDSVEPDLRENPEYGKIEIMDRTDFSSLTFSGIRSKLLSLPFVVDFIGVDYIQMFRYLPDAAGMLDAPNQYMDFFMELSLSLDGVPTSMIVLSQINRSGYNRAKSKGGEYDLFDLAEVNAIERDSAYVVTIFSDENLKESSEIKVNMPKNRFGNTIITPIICMTNPAFCIVGDELDEVGTLINEDDMMTMLGDGVVL